MSILNCEQIEAITDSLVNGQVEQAVEQLDDESKNRYELAVNLHLVMNGLGDEHHINKNKLLMRISAKS